jgi:hypothetical protein
MCVEFQQEEQVYQLQGSSLITKLLMKEFDGELYLGKVVAWMNGTEEDEALFHVLYEDSDEEDLNESEISQCIALYKKTNARQKINPKRIFDLGRLESRWTNAQKSEGTIEKTKIDPLKEAKLCNTKESSEKSQSATKSDKSSIVALKTRGGSSSPVTAYSGNRITDKKLKCDLDKVKAAFLKLVACLSCKEEQGATSQELFLDELETQVSTSTTGVQLGRVLEWLIDELQGDACTLASAWAKRCDWSKWKDDLSHITLPSQVDSTQSSSNPNLVVVHATNPSS